MGESCVVSLSPSFGFPAQHKCEVFGWVTKWIVFPDGRVSIQERERTSPPKTSSSAADSALMSITMSFVHNIAGWHLCDTHTVIYLE